MTKKSTRNTKSKNGKTRRVKKSTACLVIEYLGFDQDIDKEVEQFLRMKCTGCGFTFTDGIRDLRFEGPEDKVFEAEALIQSALLSNEDFLPQGKAMLI